MKIGISEIILIAVVALLVLGPDRLPGFTKSLAKAFKEARKVTDELTKEIKENIVEPLEEVQQPIKEAVQPFTDIKKDIDTNIKDVKKSFNSIGKPTQTEVKAKAESTVDTAVTEGKTAESEQPAAEKNTEELKEEKVQ